MSYVDAKSFMERQLLLDMLRQEEELRLTGVSKEDAALFLKATDIDSSSAASCGVFGSTHTLRVEGNPFASPAGKASNKQQQVQQQEAPDVLPNMASDTSVSNVFTHEKLFDFSTVIADASSQQDPEVEQSMQVLAQQSNSIDSRVTSEHHLVEESEHMFMKPEEKDKAIQELEQKYKDDYMATYNAKMATEIVRSAKKPAQRKRRIKRTRPKSAISSNVLSRPPEKEKPRRTKSTDTDVNTKKQGMLELTSQPTDIDSSESMSSQDTRPFVELVQKTHAVERDTVQVIKPSARANLDQSVVVHAVNAVERMEADTKVYSAQPAKQTRKSNITTNIKAATDDNAKDADVKVQQLREFTIIHPQERVLEAVARKNNPIAAGAAAPTGVSTVQTIDVVPRPAVVDVAAERKEDAIKAGPADVNASMRATQEKDASFINLTESIHLNTPDESFHVFQAVDLQKSRHRQRGSMRAIRKAIELGQSLGSSGTDQGNLLNIVVGSREHTSDPSRFPITTPPKDASTNIQAVAYPHPISHEVNTTVNSLDSTLTMTALQPAKRIVLTPQQKQQPKDDKRIDSRHTDDADITEYTDPTESLQQSMSFSSRILGETSVAQPAEQNLEDGAEPLRKKQKKADTAYLNATAVSNYFRKALYEETYGSYKLRNFLTAGTGLTLEEIRQRYGVPVMNAKQVRDVRIETIDVDHTLLPRDQHTQRIILPELDQFIGEGIVYAYPVGSKPYITGIKVAFIPNKPPRPKRKPVGILGDTEENRGFIQRQADKILRTIQKNNLTVNDELFQYKSKAGTQSVDVFKMFSELSFEYFHGLQMAKLSGDGNGTESNAVMLWHLSRGAQTGNITSSGYSVIQMSQGWAKFLLYGQSSTKDSAPAEYVTGQYESITVPRGIKFVLSSSPMHECYFVCCPVLM